MKFKKIKVLVIVLSLFAMVVMPVSAHVVVKPNQVGVGAFQTFTVGVPVEKEIATTGLKLVIPEGLNYVTPNVKPGWAISVKKTGEGEEAKVSEIEWTGGSIPAGQRDEFLFSVQVPADEATIIWKAYQTYADGSVVAWDMAPKPESEHMDSDEEENPYSETKVINDLAPMDNASGSEKGQMASSSSSNLPLVVSIVAIVMAGAALYLHTQRKGK